MIFNYDLYINSMNGVSDIFHYIPFMDLYCSLAIKTI